jgi:hypothetical protein
VKRVSTNSATQLQERTSNHLRLRWRDDAQVLDDSLRVADASAREDGVGDLGVFTAANGVGGAVA